LKGKRLFNLVSFKPIKIQGWPGVESRKQIRVNATDRFSFGLIDFRNILGHTFEGTMSTPFYEGFMPKFVEYTSPKLREVDVWLWIVEDRRAEHVFEIVRKLQPDYTVSKSHYVPAPAEGYTQHSRTRKLKS
jgi:hypothetical protein